MSGAKEERPNHLRKVRARRYGWRPDDNDDAHAGLGERLGNDGRNRQNRPAVRTPCFVDAIATAIRRFRRLVCANSNGHRCLQASLQQLGSLHCMAIEDRADFWRLDVLLPAGITVAGTVRNAAAISGGTLGGKLEDGHIVKLRRV